MSGGDEVTQPRLLHQVGALVSEAQIVVLIFSKVGYFCNDVFKMYEFDVDAADVRI